MLYYHASSPRIIFIGEQKQKKEKNTNRSTLCAHINISSPQGIVCNVNVWILTMSIILHKFNKSNADRLTANCCLFDNNVCFFLQILLLEKILSSEILSFIILHYYSYCEQCVSYTMVCVMRHLPATCRLALRKTCVYIYIYIS